MVSQRSRQLLNIDKSLPLRQEMKVYITGCDHGLGLALAASFLEHGCQVFAGLYGIDSSGLEALKRRYGDRLEIVPLDVSRDASVSAAAQSLRLKPTAWMC